MLALKSLLILSLSLFTLISTGAPLKLPHVESFNDQLAPGSKLTLKTEAGHHFNQDSPLSCGQDITPKIENGQLSCTYPESGEYRAFIAVCDDAKKFCKIFRPLIKVGKSTGKAVSAKKATKQPRIQFGFKLGSPEQTLEANLNSPKAKPVLLDFFALWCPPCNDLDEMIFPTAAFTNETKDVEKIKINVDEEESWALKEKFKIVGYPTLVYLNSRGEEIGRFWGTQSPELLVSWIQKMKRLEAMPISWAAKQSDPLNVKRIVEWNFDLENYQEVKTLTAARNEDWAQKYFLRTQARLIDTEKDKKEYAKILKTLLSKFPNDIMVGYWVLYLATPDKKAAEKLLPTAIKNIDMWISQPEKAIQENYSVQDLVLLKTDLFETLGSKEDLKKSQLETIAFLEKELAGGKKLSRGRSHILAYYYREVGRVEDAKKIYEALVKDQPKEFTFYYRYAKALHDLKEFEPALMWLEKGAPYTTEGNSRLQYTWLKGKILVAVGKKADALQFINGTLAIAKTATWNRDSSNRWIKDLKALKTEIEEKK
ncbi:MAG: thioredoxin domain-containing protein [Bdellovibrionota bacterium]